MEKLAETIVRFVVFSITLHTSKSFEIEIIKARQAPQFGMKVEAEAELAFFSKQLGFVHDKFLLKNSPTQILIQEYLDYKKGQEAEDVKITKKYFVGHGELLCRAYLIDPVLQENEIEFYPENPSNPIRYELKSLYFLHFSRTFDLVKVIRCPVLAKNEETLLYFQEIRYSANNSGLRHRAYFVFQNSQITLDGRQVLEILMFTRFNRPTVELPVLDDSGGEEAEIRDSRGLVSPFSFIRLSISKDSSQDSFRSFGEKAELFYTTKTYGFFDYFRSYWRIKEFLQIIEQLKKGYQINVDKMIEVKKEGNEAACENYLMRSYQLLQKNIVPKKNPSLDEVKWVEKNVKFPKNENLPVQKNVEVLKCPIKMNGDNRIRNIYILPIHYTIKKKSPGLFSFKDVAGDSKQVYPFSLNPVEQKNYELGTIFSTSDEEEETRKKGKIIEAYSEVGN